MARGKKKEKGLTLKEKMQQALVPVGEQPYEIPRNWCWTRVGYVCSFIGGGTPSKDNPEYWNGEISWASVKDIKGDYLFETIDHITKEGFQNSSANMCKKGSLILVTRIEPAKTIISEIDTAINQDLKIVNSTLSSIFLHYYFRTFQHEFIHKASGSTVKGITIPNVERTLIPLPPLTEQQRIVDRIESLFTKLDEAKEKAQAVVDGFEDRKAAILHKAFTGAYSKRSDKTAVEELIKRIFQIREALIKSKGIKRTKYVEVRSDEEIKSFPSQWKQVKLGSIAFVTKLAGFEYTKYIRLEQNGEIPVIRAQNVRKGYLDLRNLLYIDRKTSDLLSRSALKRDSVLITFIGAGIGDVCAFEQKRQFHLAPNVAKVEPYCGEKKDLINIKFLLYYLLSPYGQHEIFKSMKATAQPSLSMETIRDIIVPVPDYGEQCSIAKSLELLILSEEQAKESAEHVIDQIDSMKKSILARAFHGELGTNDPTDESAEDLLKRIL